LKVNIIILVILFFSSLFAGEKYEQYQGQFIKKSIGVTNLIDLRKGKNKNLSKYSRVNRLIRNNLYLKRFDINKIEQTKAHQQFIHSIKLENKRGINYNKLLTKNISKYLSDEILKITKDSSYHRAKQMITDAQSSSMLATKSKENFVYESQIATKANSSYIFIPTVENFTVTMAADSISQKKVSKKKYKKGFRYFYGEGLYAIYIYKIEKLKSNRQKITKLKKITRTIEFTSIQKRKYADKNMFPTFIKSIPNNIKSSSVKTRIEEINDFLLTEQIIYSQDDEIWFPLGKDVGLSINDKFWHTTFVEKNGTVNEQRNGWVIVTKVGEKKDQYSSHAQVIKGNPDVGDVVKEIPLIGVTTNIGIASEPIYSDKIDTLGVINNFKIKNCLIFNISSKFFVGERVGISQMSFLINMSIGGGYASGNSIHNKSDNEDDKNNPMKNIHANINNYMTTNISIGFDKKFYFKRFAIVPGLFFNYRSVDINSGSIYIPNENYYNNNDSLISGDTYLYWTYETIGLNINSSFEYAISPKFNIGVGVSYFFNSPTNKLKLYASSDQLPPSFSSAAKFFKSIGGNKDDIAGNDRIGYFDEKTEIVDIDNSGFGFSGYISWEF